MSDTIKKAHELLGDWYGRNIKNRDLIVLRDLIELAEKQQRALRPFAHADLCRAHPGNNEGEDSPVFQRNRATLRLRDFRRASDLVTGS